MFDSMLEMSGGYSGGRGGSSSTTFIVMLMLAIGATIAMFILVLPDRKRNTLPPFLQGVADFFNLHYLLIEKIFKAIYVFLTIFVILYGITFLFQEFIVGLAMIVLGPIAIRIFHELMMLLILAVNNLMEINHKMGPKPGKGSKTSEPAAGGRTAFRNYGAQGGQEYYGGQQGQYAAPQQQPAQPPQTYGGQGGYYGSRQQTGPQQGMMPQQNMAPQQQQQYTGGYSYAGQAEPRTRRVNR